MLTISARHNVHQLRDFAPLFRAVARGDRVLDTMRDMIAQDLFLGAPQCCPHRRNLRDNVDAVPVLLDHAGETADLALDPAEPVESGLLDILAHAPNIPIRGSCFKPSQAMSTP